MSGFVVVGSQWGDEGKGKIVDLLTERVDIVARYGGGPNAGHTICVGDRRFALHHIPSGILRADVLCVIGNGVVIDPASLLKEVGALREAGVLCGGAQGTMLDLDHGTYPYVTSSTSTAGGACTGLGISPIRVDGVIGVLKAYSTRVGGGPFPTEQDNDLGRLIRERGREYGSTTGRPRRCGWFDALVARYSVMINQVECLALTLFDVLDDFDEIPIAVAYEHDGRRIDFPPTDPAVLRACRPVYEV